MFVFSSTYLSLFVFAFRNYGVVLERVVFTPKIDRIVYPITVLGVSVDRDVVVVGEYVVIKVPFFVPYESSVSLFNFTVYIYYNDKLVYFAWRFRPCFPGEYAMLKFRFKAFVPGKHVVVFRVYKGRELLYEEEVSFIVIRISKI